MCTRIADHEQQERQIGADPQHLARGQAVDDLDEKHRYRPLHQDQHQNARHHPAHRQAQIRPEAHPQQREGEREQQVAQRQPHPGGQQRARAHGERGDGVREAGQGPPAQAAHVRQAPVLGPEGQADDDVDAGPHGIQRGQVKRHGGVGKPVGIGGGGARPAGAGRAFGKNGPLQHALPRASAG